MSYKKHMKSPSSKMASEEKILTVDEYLQLGELFKQFKESQDRDSKAMIILDINQYIERFSAESKVLFYYENWSKETTQSDSYMSLILNLRRLSEEAYEKEIFKNLM